MFVERFKIVTYLLFCFVFVGAPGASASISIYDDFSSNSISTAVWGYKIPFSDSGVQVVGGELELKGGGGIYLKSEANPNGGEIIISFKARSIGGIDNYINIYTRSDAPDLKIYPRYTPVNMPINGMLTSVADVGYWDSGAGTNVIRGQTILSQTFGERNPGAEGVTYNFKIIDTLTSIQVFRDGVQLLSANYADKFDHNYIGIFNRDNDGWMNNIVYIDNLSIEQKNKSATPIPGAVWLFGSGLAGLVGFRRKSLA